MMRKIAAALLVTLLPLGGCATPYGYSSGAYADYDPYYDSGYQGYERTGGYYGESYGRPYGTAAEAYGGYGSYGYGQPAYGAGYAYSYPQTYSYAYVTPQVYYQQPAGYYSTYYGCGC